MDAPYLGEEEMQLVYNWVDEVPLSRPKKNIARDFSDGVLAAEIVRHYFPKLVDLHNYSAAHSISQKKYNWITLNNKVLKKLGMQISKADIDRIVNCTPNAIEPILKILQAKINACRAKGGETISEKRPVVMQPRPAVQNKSSDKGSPGVMHSPMMGPDQETMEMLAEKDQTIQELKETIEIMELKINKLEQLVRLKDNKIQTLSSKLAQAGIQS